MTLQTDTSHPYPPTGPRWQEQQQGRTPKKGAHVGVVWLVGLLGLGVGAGAGIAGGIKWEHDRLAVPLAECLGASLAGREAVHQAEVAFDEIDGHLGDVEDSVEAIDWAWRSGDYEGIGDGLDDLLMMRLNYSWAPQDFWDQSDDCDTAIMKY